MNEMNEEEKKLNKKKKITRVFSDAFPPNKLGLKDKIPSYSQVHKNLREFNIEESKIYYRELTQYDKEEIQLLHKEWFPLDYEEDYFEKIFDPEKRDKEYFTLGAFYKNEDNEIILGAIICELKSQREFIFTMPEEAIHKLDIPFFEDLNPFEKEFKFAYVMTLGVVDECRRLKLGSILLNKMIQFFLRRKDCLCIYLHVVFYNTTAIKFYQRNNFVNVATLKNYYKIKNEKYDSEIYVNFFSAKEKAKVDSENIIVKFLHTVFIKPVQFILFCITCGFCCRCYRRKHKLE